jgi:hypothetical protein
MTQMVLPYTIKCPGCGVGVKIKDERAIGKQINCPKCSKKFEVPAPHEESSIPYTLITTGEKEEVEKKKKTSREEIEARIREKEELQKKEKIAKIKHWVSVSWLVIVLLVMCWGLYYFVYLGNFYKMFPDLFKNEATSSIVIEATRHFV